MTQRKEDSPRAATSPARPSVGGAKTRTFPAFTQRAPRAPGQGQPVKRRPALKTARSDHRLTAILAGILAGLVVAFLYGLYTPKTPWAFDRPDAYLPSLQQCHTLQ